MIEPLDANPGLLGAAVVPPASPAPGDAYLVLNGAQGDWLGQDGMIATWGGSAWAFAAPVADWLTSYALLPPVFDASWPTAFAGWYADRIAPIEPDPAVFTAVGFVFVFPTAAFISALAALPPAPTSLAVATGFANAWAAGMATILFPAGISVLPGSAIGPAIPPPTPANTFSAVASVLLDVASQAAGQAKILELASAPIAFDPLQSAFAEKFRDATLLLTMTVSGTNSAPSPAPLTAPAIPLV